MGERLGYIGLGVMGPRADYATIRSTVDAVFHELGLEAVAAIVAHLQHHGPVGPVGEVRIDEGESDGA